MRMVDLIARKRRGETHDPAELEFIARAAADGKVPDYQFSAWLMAVCWRGMTEAETTALTKAMAASGARFKRGEFGKAAVDKHSTGGVGDGISLPLAPLVAAAGLAVPMMSGRGLAHTGGTLDKLESIKGMKVALPMSAIRRQMARLGLCMFGQSADIAPSDRRLYSIRDVTATVESLPLVVSSILSKKAAEGLDALVLDVKVGSGAIFQEPARAREAARAMAATARRLGMKCAALLTAMDQPLGLQIGNALEIRQAVEILQGDRRASDYLECLLALGGWMLHLGGKSRSWEEGAARLEKLIADGSGLALFRKMVQAQGGDPRVVDDPGRLPRSPLSLRVAAGSDGFISWMDARTVGRAGIVLGAGRAAKEDRLDFGAGITLERKVGARVRRGDLVATLYARDGARLKEAEAVFLSSLKYSPKAPRPGPVVKEVIQ